MAKQIVAAKETVELRFDPAAFFQTVGQGRSISTYRKNEIIFHRAMRRTQYSISKKAKLKSPLSPSRERKPWSRSSA
jgi:hypothetical protein